MDTVTNINNVNDAEWAKIKQKVQMIAEEAYHGSKPAKILTASGLTAAAGGALAWILGSGPVATVGKWACIAASPLLVAAGIFTGYRHTKKSEEKINQLIGEESKILVETYAKKLSADGLMSQTVAAAFSQDLVDEIQSKKK